jgi:phage terminase large subunit
MKNFGNIENSDPSKIGWDTTTGTRPKMLQDLKEVIDNKTIRIYDPITVKELFTFIIKKTGKPEAEDNAHDDLVMSLAIAWQLQQTEHIPVPISRQQPVPAYQPADDVIGV